VRELRSWRRFTFNYALGLVPRSPYRFRNGAVLKIARGVEHAPIVEVFIRKEYGAPSGAATIVDLGASVGVFSVYAAVLAPCSTVYAYEPSPEAFRLLNENVRLNGLSNRVRTFDLAVGGATGRRVLHTGGEGLFFPTTVARGPSTAQVDVACTTLAEILASNDLRRVDLLKLDVEGAEYELLRAAPDEFLERIAEIRMETHDLDAADRNTPALTSFLRDRGFAIVRDTSSGRGVHTVWALRDPREAQREGAA
jgi:FkbM family methyltransferase